MATRTPSGRTKNLDRTGFRPYPQRLMPQTDAEPKQRRGLFGPRNLVMMAVALGFLVVGYLTLSAGSPSLAAVLLVTGYCVLLPLAIAL